MTRLFGLSPAQGECWLAVSCAAAAAAKSEPPEPRTSLKGAGFDANSIEAAASEGSQEIEKEVSHLSSSLSSSLSWSNSAAPARAHWESRCRRRLRTKPVLGF